MQLDQAMLERRSIRGFQDKPVPRALLEEIITLANRAPSSMNTQPWHLHVLTGEPLEKVREGNSTRMMSGVPPVREIIDHGAYEGPHRDRQVGIAKQLFAAMGIARDDKAMRQDWVMRGFRQFDAPVSIVVTFDKSLEGGTIAHFDLGAVTYGLVLAQIPDDQVIMTCVALGWPNEDFAANGVVSTRREVDEMARFVGFED